MAKMVEFANEYGGLALGAAGGASLLVLLLRSAIGNASKGMLGVSADAATNDVIKHLQAEVERHEKHQKETDEKIASMSARMDSMQTERMLLLQALMMAQAQATNALMIVKTMCACEKEDRERLQRALAEIIDLTLNAMHGTTRPSGAARPAANDNLVGSPSDGGE